MADKKKSNITKISSKKKKSNVTPKKKPTQAQLASAYSKYVYMSARSYRNMGYIQRYADMINSKVNPTDDEALEEKIDNVLSHSVWERDNTDKRRIISIAQLKALSKLPAEELRMIIEKLDKTINAGGNFKAELANLLPDGEISSKVTLPSHVNQWYIEQAAEKGISKTLMMQRVLTLWTIIGGIGGTESENNIEEE